jgi:ADP-ribosylglycohydrolase
MPTTPQRPDDWSPARPIPGSYWVVPGRLLVGEYPGSRSRADSMARLRSFLDAGVTCFIDLTEAKELAGYESLLPAAAASGRPVIYVRQPIPDHGVPGERSTMQGILDLLDAALAEGHAVYVHCRAGIGRSATVAGCWLATQRGDAGAALDELAVAWRQAAQSRDWPSVPETSEQEDFVRRWLEPDDSVATALRQVDPSAVPRSEKISGALLGLAVGDAIGAAAGGVRAGNLVYTQHTALTLCLAASLLETGRCDARDQIDRYVRWRRDGYCSATGQPGQASPDVERALGTYLWRGQPRAGSHDPNDRCAASLPRVVAAVLFEARDPAAAVALAGESSRTTHQSPVVIDACRFLAAMLTAALQGLPREQVLEGLCEPVPGLWARKPLKPDVVAMATRHPLPAAAGTRADTALDAVAAIANARAAVRAASTFEGAVRSAREGGGEGSLDGALAGATYGMLYGAATIPPTRLASLAGVEQVEQIVARLRDRDEGAVK